MTAETVPPGPPPETRAAERRGEPGPATAAHRGAWELKEQRKGQSQAGSPGHALGAQRKGSVTELGQEVDWRLCSAGPAARSAESLGRAASRSRPSRAAEGRGGPPARAGRQRGCWAQGLWVSQPSWAQGPEGGSVTLRCSYHSPRAPQLGSYAWEKEVGGAWLEVSDGHPEFRGRVRRTGERSFLQERRADLELHHLRPYDNGTYRCLVNIPLVGQGVGNGTWLQVLPAAPPPAPTSPLALAVAVGLGTALGITGGAAALVWFCHRQRREPSEVRPQKEAPVQAPGPMLTYAELRVQPGRHPVPVGNPVTYAALGSRGGAGGAGHPPADPPSRSRRAPRAFLPPPTGGRHCPTQPKAAVPPSTTRGPPALLPPAWGRPRHPLP
ncbi:uncharacterized protein LOC142025127 [Carettochelys insculpta]|uniref:uncharacterized protein LOC142025127 n=1 Tax=Carettochelys insculpta TaxID=44489 RepID=UPI003EBF79AE